MSVWSVRLPTESVTVEAPVLAATALRQFFPAVTAAAADASPARWAIAAEGELWRLEEDGAAIGRFAAPAFAVAALEQRWVELVARSARRAIAFHAGAVEVFGSAVLIAGLAESGKTATTVQLVELGHTFVADEIAVVEAAGDRVRPFHRSPAVGASFVADLFSAADPAHGALVEPAPGLARYLPRRLARDGVAVSALLLPRYRRGAATVVEELAAAAVLTEVLGYCFEPAGEPERLVDALIAHLGRWSIRRLTYGDSTAARAALLEVFAPPEGISGEPR